MSNRTRHAKPSRIRKAIVRLLARIPTNCKLLYPFYCSAQLSLKEETYTSPALPSELDGYRIAYASDIHFGPYLGKERVLDLADRLTALDADLLLLGGDYGVRTKDSIAFFEAFPRLSFPDGIVAVTGNHDLAGTAQEVEAMYAAMRDKGIVPVINGCHIIHRGNATMSVCSVDDFRSGQPDYATAAKEIAPNSFILFAPHSPDVMPELQGNGAFTPHLTVCGHTHGGQVALFGRSLHSSSKYKDRYLSGWKHENGMDILVSNGVGTSMMPVRLGAPAQYHVITLQRGTPHSHHP